jgi:hypothetical protein
MGTPLYSGCKGYDSNARMTTAFNAAIFLSHDSQMHWYHNRKLTTSEATTIVSPAQPAPVPMVRPAFKPAPT